MLGLYLDGMLKNVLPELPFLFVPFLGGAYLRL
jgi:hypothetical protein